MSFRQGARQFFERRGAPTPPIPYDARVLYVETDGVGSYINTGIVPDGSSVISISFAVQSLSYEGSGTTYNCVCGAAVPNTNLLVGRFGLNVSYNNAQFRFSTPSLTNYATDSPAYDHFIHDAVIAYPENGGVIFDGTQLSTNSPSSSLIYDVLCLGAGRDVVRDTNTNRNRLFSGTRFYSCKIYTNNVLVFDGIPVRKNGQGYIYDRVSGRLCGNAGAAGTSVTYGADVPFDEYVEYLESTGTQWIDTGVYGRDGLLIEALMTRSTNSSKTWLFGIMESVSTIVGAQVNINNGAVNTGLYSALGSASNVVLDDSFHKYLIDTTGGNKFASVDGVTIRTLDSSSSGQTSSTMKLFGALVASSVLVSSCRASRFSIKSTTTSQLLLDLVPVRFTNALGESEGAMYDRVSGRLFRNAGTGAFIYGPDKTANLNGGGGRKCVRFSPFSFSRLRFSRRSAWKEAA